MDQSDQVYIGKCCWFNKNYGFAEWYKDGIQQPDIFLHFSNIEMSGYRTLKKDQQISFQLGTNNKGQLIAIRIKPVV